MHDAAVIAAVLETECVPELVDGFGRRPFMKELGRGPVSLIQPEAGQRYDGGRAADIGLPKDQIQPGGIEIDLRDAKVLDARAGSFPEPLQKSAGQVLIAFAIIGTRRYIELQIVGDEPIESAGESAAESVDDGRIDRSE